MSGVAGVRGLPSLSVVGWLAGLPLSIRMLVGSEVVVAGVAVLVKPAR